MSPIADLQTIALGPDGLTVPALGVGTWAWGDSLFWDYGKGVRHTLSGENKSRRPLR